MNITNIRIRPSDGTTARVATVSIVIDNAISLHGLGIVKRKDNDELFVSMAAHKNRAGEYRDIYYHPISTEVRQELTEKILDAWKQYQENPEVTSFDMGDPDAEIKVDSVRFYEHTVGERTFVSASAILDDAMVLGMINIGHRDDEEHSLYMRMPSRKMPDGTPKDVYHPISSEARKALSDVIFKAYEERDTAAEA